MKSESGPNWFACVTIFVLNVTSQAMQNICLPLTLSSGDDMAVVMVYTAFIYFVVFSLLDVILAQFVRVDEVPLNQTTVAIVGFQNACSGFGVVFGGSNQRTPLTLQMSGGLALNLLAAPYRLWVYNMPLRKLAAAAAPYAAACVLYTIAFALMLIDKLRHVQEGSGAINWMCSFFFIGIMFGMTYNVHQDKMISHVEMKSLSTLQAVATAVQILRKQTTWVFIFSWLSVLLALIPTIDQEGTLNTTTFFKAWANLLPFSNMWMNLFNLAYLVTFITGVFMNKYDSSFNMLSSNISAVLSLWTGWVPAISAQTVGFSPSLSLTIPAMVIALVAVIPSYLYSKKMMKVMVENQYEPLLGKRKTVSIQAEWTPSVL